MFWQSVSSGLGVLLHWQTYVVAAMYIVISFLPFIALMPAGDRCDSYLEKGGCLLMLVQPLFQALAVFISVCTLFPIVLGRAAAAWSLPWLLIAAAPGRTLIVVVIMLVLAVLGSLVPIIGQANSFIMFIMGGVVLVFLTRAIGEVYPDSGIKDIRLIPGLLTIIGIVLVSGIVSWLGTLASAALLTLVQRANEGISQLIILPFGSVFGFIPVFIYGAWIRLQIKGLG
jgi:hypothetical protein